MYTRSSQESLLVLATWKGNLVLGRTGKVGGSCTVQEAVLEGESTEEMKSLGSHGLVSEQCSFSWGEQDQETARAGNGLARKCNWCGRWQYGRVGRVES